MSDVGEGLDNTVIDSFNATIKRELIDRRCWSSHDEVSMAIIEYITSWYNPYRCHLSLGYKSLVKYEIALAIGQISTKQSESGGSPESS